MEQQLLWRASVGAFAVQTAEEQAAVQQLAQRRLITSRPTLRPGEKRQALSTDHTVVTGITVAGLRHLNRLQR